MDIVKIRLWNEPRKAWIQTQLVNWKSLCFSYTKKLRLSVTLVPLILNQNPVEEKLLRVFSAIQWRRAVHVRRLQAHDSSCWRWRERIRMFHWVLMNDGSPAMIFIYMFQSFCSFCRLSQNSFCPNFCLGIKLCI